MSQPIDYGPHESDPLAVSLTSMQQAVDLFVHAERSKDQCMIGVEYEMFGHDRTRKIPLQYRGSTSIETLFKHIFQQLKGLGEQAQLLQEGENIVGISCDKAVIALEPGGQIEIAARPFASLQHAITNFTEAIEIVVRCAQDLAIDLFSVGLHPVATREEMAVVKKARYAIMRQYMSQINGRGLDMMTRSCAIQLNVDYENEADMVKKTKLCAALTPIYAILCSSSAFLDGQPTQHPVMRSRIWQETDPQRTGIPALIFDAHFGYERWVEYALDVPMYFIRRDNQYHNVAGASFREFFRNGLLGFTATVRDFFDHLSTIFTEVRLKPILEIRSPDSLPLPFVNALTALTWTLIYDEHAHDQASALFQDMNAQELQQFHSDVIKIGRQAQFRGQNVFELANKLVCIADNSLKSSRGIVQKDVLLPFFQLLEKNQSIAEIIAHRYKAMDNTNFYRLVKDFHPLHNPLL